MPEFRPHGVYIIVDDGRNAYFKGFSDHAPSPDLVSAMLTAMQSFVFEVTGAYFSDLTAGPFSFTSEKVGPFAVVLASTKSEKAEEYTKYLALRFIKRFALLLENWNGETADFEAFDVDVTEIFGVLPSRRIDIKNPIDAATLMTLKQDLQSVVRYLLIKGDSSIEQIAAGINESEILVQTKINELLALGHIGKILGTDVRFFVR